MILGFDGNEANVENRVGIGAYAYAIFSHVVKLLPQSDSLRVYLKEKPLADLPRRSGQVSYEIVRPKRLWTQVGLPLRLFREKNKPDIFFTPSHYAPRFSPVPVAIAVMDVSFLHFPDTFARKDLMQLRSWTAYSIKKASVIFTISQASKNDILEKYHIESQKVVVTYPGIRKISTLRPAVYTKNMAKNEFGVDGEYFLFVGTLQPRKNIVRLIEAFAKLKQTKKVEESVKLVIVGKKGWLFEDIVDAPKKLGVSDSVIFLEFVSDEDLPLLYKNAIAFVLPSLYEGFGLPVLEAMNFDCPVITSNVSSLPEAGGDAAVYVDPQSVSDIAAKMAQVYSDKSLRIRMIEKGREQVKKFSWEKSAEKTLEVLHQVVDSQREKK